MSTEKVVSVEGSWVKSDVKLTGKTVIITGANTGIGFCTAVDLAKRGARVIMACRNVEKAEEARQKVIQQSESDESKVATKQLDLSSFASINKFADEINSSEQRLDILINNAGIMVCPEGKTEDGFETQFGVNHLGHFLLTNRLLDLIKKSAPSRIVVVSSLAHEFGSMNWDDLNNFKNYGPMKAYGQSKLANILFSRHLSKLLEGTGVTVNSLHPGSVRTDLQRHADASTAPLYLRWLMAISRWPIINHFVAKWIDADQGAQTSIYLAIAPELSDVSGKYFTDCKLKGESRAAKSDADAERLWKVSLEMTKLSE